MKALTRTRVAFKVRKPLLHSRALTTPSAPPKRPSRMSAYLSQLRARYPSAEPTSLIASFLILHELTAIVPLFAGFLGLRWFGVGDGVMNWVLDEAETQSAGEALTEGGVVAWCRGKLREWVITGEDQAQRVGRRYGVFGYAKETKEARDERRNREKDQADRGVVTTREPYAVGGDVANFLVAYIAVKALAPLRIVLSARLAPPMANLLVSKIKVLRDVGARYLAKRP